MLDCWQIYGLWDLQYDSRNHSLYALQDGVTIGYSNLGPKKLSSLTGQRFCQEISKLILCIDMMNM
jgi:hypothetical protein